uniref:Uncharacterized protein n=1 Tax=Candidatus Kentrum sp. DK TaxID=2126562 RepID=A0A450T1R1_9GAMM|nr:MAG: hypothetical protein BECKDK2373C_GA0170839_10818 [Candidatus Kentron sp. DK]
MKLNLEQHLYADRLNSYTTIAESPGIGQDLRPELEKRVQAPPDADVTALRCYPLRGGELFGLSFLALRYGARCSHIAHSYVIERQALSEAGWNLPWVALHLPFWADYRPPTQGIDRLEKILIEIDRGGQLNMLRWLRAISPVPGWVQEWQGRLLATIANGESIRIVFDEPLPCLQKESQKIFNRTAPIRPDMLNLWRTVGLLAPIPGIFQEQLSITINEDGGQGANCKVMLSADEPSQLPLPKIGELTYLTHYYTLLEEKHETPHEFQDNVAAFLPDRSIRALDAATRYHLSSNREEQADQLLLLWEAQAPENFGHSSTRIITEAAIGLLQNGSLQSSLNKKHRLFTETADRAFSGVFSDDPVAVELFGWSFDKEANLSEQHDLLHGLHDHTKIRLWDLAERLEKPPARIMENQDLQWTVVWNDALFSGLNESQQSDTIHRLACTLWNRGSSDRSETIRELIGLGDVLDVLPDVDFATCDLGKGLVSWMVRDLAACHSPFEAISKYARGSEKRIRMGALLGAELAIRFWDTNRSCVLDYILNLQRQDPPYIENRYRLCQGIAEFSRNHTDIKKLVDSQCELLYLLMGKPSPDYYSNSDHSGSPIDLNAYKDWSRHCRPKSSLLNPRPEESPCYTQFHQNLRNIVRRWPVLDALCIAILYLNADPHESTSMAGLYGAFIDRMGEDPANKSKAIAWLSGSHSTPAAGVLYHRISSHDMLALFVKAFYVGKNTYSINNDRIREILEASVYHRIIADRENYSVLEKSFDCLEVPKKILKETAKMVNGKMR